MQRIVLTKYLLQCSVRFHSWFHVFWAILSWSVLRSPKHTHHPKYIIPLTVYFRSNYFLKMTHLTAKRASSDYKEKYYQLRGYELKLALTKTINSSNRSLKPEIVNNRSRNAPPPRPRLLDNVCALTRCRQPMLIPPFVNLEANGECLPITNI